MIYENLIYIVALIAFIAWGAWTSRIAAGGWPSQEILIPGQWLFAIPYAVVFYACSGALAGLAALALVACGLRQATYPYSTLGTLLRVDTRRVPPLDFLIRPWFGAISPSGGQYWRCVAGLTVEGLAASIPLAVAYSLLIGDFKSGLIVALAGIARPAAYMLELWLSKRGLFKIGVIGDVFRGAFLNAVMVIAWIL